MRVVAVVTLQAKPWTCCGAFTLFQMYRRGKSAGLTPAAVSMLGLGLSVFKGLRQADQHSAHERGIILRERVHDLQSSLARRTHGSLRLPCVRTERLLHVRACVGSPARDVVENGFPLLFGAVARLLGGLLDAGAAPAGHVRVRARYGVLHFEQKCLRTNRTNMEFVQ